MSGMTHTSRRPSLVRLLMGLAVLVASLAGASSAHAREDTGCSERVIEQPFAAWDDLADYFLAPDGAFTGGAVGWELTGASVVAENEPWYLPGGDTPAAVQLESGGSAISPTICVAETDPTMRFVARSAGDAAGTLDVDVLYTDADGIPQALTIGTVAASEATEWTPSAALPIVVNTYEMDVSFRFTARGEGSAWLIDDVYVDPYRKGR